MFCRKCGHQLPDDAIFCDACGTRVAPAAPAAPASPLGNASSYMAAVKKLPLMKILGIVAVILVAVVALSVIASGGSNRCDASGCRNEKQFGEYCIEHVCMYGSCTNRRTVGEYCSTHRSGGSAYSSYNYANASNDLVFSNIQIEHNSSYTVVTGRVTNNGSVTYRFVKIKGNFKTSSGTTVDTDWTYAVGSEGLAPGESTTFRMSIPKDRSVTKCTITILDYDT